MSYLLEQAGALVSGFFFEKGKIKFEELAEKNGVIKEIDDYIKDYFEKQFYNFSLNEEYKFGALKEYLDNSYDKIFEFFYCVDRAERESLKNTFINGAYSESFADTETKKKIVFKLLNCIFEIADNYLVKQINGKDIFLLNKYFDEQNELINSLDKKITQGFERLNYRGSFEEIVDNLPKKGVQKKNKMYFTNPDIPFVGRTKEICQINEFLDSDEKVQFTAITGEGGIGKSRLLYHFMRENEYKLNWKMRFIEIKDIKKITNLVGDLYYPKDILLVIDYVLGNEEAISEFICSFNKEKCKNKIRIILLERQPFTKDKDGNKIQPVWYTNLKSKIELQGQLKEIEYRFENNFITLSSLSDDDLKELVKRYYKNIKGKDIETKIVDDIIDNYKSLKQQRTLFLLLIIDSYINNEGFTKWDEEQLIGFYLKRHKDTLKKVSSKIDYAHIENIMFYSFFSDGWDYHKELTAPFSTDYNEFVKLDDSYIKTIVQNINQNDELSIIQPLYPDILTEYFILDYIKEHKSNMNILNERIKVAVNSNLAQSKTIFLRIIQNFCNSEDFNGIFKEFNSYINHYNDNYIFHSIAFDYLSFYSKKAIDIDNFIANNFKSCEDFIKKVSQISNIKIKNIVALRYENGLFNLSNAYKVIKDKEKQLEKLENLYSEIKTEDVAIQYAKGLFNLSNKYKEITDKKSIIEKLEKLYEKTETEELAIIYAKGLFNLSKDYKEIKDKERQLEKLEKFYNEIKTKEVAIPYAKGLVNLSFKYEEITDKERQLEKLENLYSETKAEEVAIEYAKGLFNLSNDYEEVKDKEKQLEKLENLYSETKAEEVAIVYANGLFNLSNDYKEIKDKERQLEKLEKLCNIEKLEQIAILTSVLYLVFSENSNNDNDKNHYLEKAKEKYEEYNLKESLNTEYVFLEDLKQFFEADN